MQPQFFETPADFRRWLEENAAKSTEIIVGFYKTGSGLPSITWPQSVDEALCFGWIDGVRRSIDDKSYCIRFTPRKPASIWSAVNIKKVAELTEKSLMKPEGLAAFANRKEEKSAVYSFENEPVDFKPEYELQLRGNAAAWEYFSKQAPWYRRLAAFRVMSARQEKTQLSRLQKLIEYSARGERVPG